MVRRARIVVPGVPHHITHRGNRAEPIFFEDGDQEIYLGLLGRVLARYDVCLWAYCLMSNHVHLILVPPDAAALAAVIREAHSRYSRLINERAGWTGHLLANRFYNAGLDEDHLWAAIRYVEQNPVRAGLVRSAIDWPWSSARAHAGMVPDGILDPNRPFVGAIADWADWLEQDLGETQLAAIRAHTRTGRPLGKPEFVEAALRRAGRQVVRMPPGPRPQWERLGLR